MVKIGLTVDEMEQGRDLGLTRFRDSRYRGLTLEFVDTNNEADILGAQGEMVVAKWLGLDFVPTVGTFKKPDIDGTDLQVRTTKYSTGGLPIKPNDNPNHRYILVVGKHAPEFSIVGWCWGFEAIAWAETKTSHNGQEFRVVTQDKLRPMETFDLYELEYEF